MTILSLTASPPWRDACASSNATVLSHCCNDTHITGCDLRIMRKPNGTADDGENHTARFAVDQPWTLSYEFAVPTHKPTGLVAASSTYYIWGDVDFDSYGVAPRAAFPMSKYIYNQIVPQLVLGNALASNDASYTPRWTVFHDWAVQAQYYWSSCSKALGRRCAPGHSRSFALCGAAVNVTGGDTIETTITYDPTDGSITAAIGAKGASTRSAVQLARPFPNEVPALWGSWRDFFIAAQRLSESTVGPGILSHPDFNIETHQVPPSELCEICPFRLANSTAAGELNNLSWWDVNEFNGTSAADVACAQGCLVPGPSSGLL